MTKHGFRLRRELSPLLAGFLAVGCAHAGQQGVVIPEVVDIPAGSVIAGLDRVGRELAYSLDEAAYGTRQRVPESGMRRSANVSALRHEHLRSAGFRLPMHSTPPLLMRLTTPLRMCPKRYGTHTD